MVSGAVARNGTPVPRVDPLDAAHPVAVRQHTRHARRDANLGAGRAGGFEQQRVEDRSARGAERGYSPARADVDGLDLVAVSELGGRNGRGASVDDRIEQIPAVQLQHAATHERVGGKGVGARPCRLDDEHAHAATGQQHRGGRPRTASADDDHVVVVVHQMVLSWSRDNGQGARSGLPRRRRHRRSGSTCGGAETASPSGRGRGSR